MRDTTLQIIVIILLCAVILFITISMEKTQNRFKELTKAQLYVDTLDLNYFGQYCIDHKIDQRVYKSPWYFGTWYVYTLPTSNKIQWVHWEIF